MIHGVSSTNAIASPVGGGPTSGGTATNVMIEMGGRASAWVAQLGGAANGPGGFRPDLQTLARGGDVYGIGEVVRDVAGRLGAGPAEEGALHRAIEDFTREAVVTSVVFADEPAVARGRIEGALPVGVPGGGVESVSGVIAQIEQATAALQG